MRGIYLILSTILLVGCATTSDQAVEISEDDQIAVCGEVAGEKQTYPTLGDLHNDGAKFLYYGPCYE